jgi:hypothetical protein
VAGFIEPIDDPNLARDFLEKVNQLNNDTGRDCLFVAGIWSALPQGLAGSLATVSLLLGSLYLLRDKIPTKDVSI